MQTLRRSSLARASTALAAAFVCQLALACSAWAQATESCCSVTVTVRTAEGLSVPRAAIRIESGAMRYDASTATDGQAVTELRTPGRYRIVASAPGYAPGQREFDVGRDEHPRVEIALVRRDTVTVEGRASTLDPQTAASEAAREPIRSLPERVADLRNALPLIPGVVRTPEGRLQISGTPEYRNAYLVNSIDVTDPATGSFGATVPIDIIETIQVYKSPFLAEYGRFSSAVVAVSTRRGGDKWHFELNDPSPEFRIRSGRLHGVRGFTPRIAATGPLAPGKLYFAGATSYELRKRPTYPLPFPFNEEKSERVNAYTQFDYIPRATHHVSLSLHGVPQRQDFANLNFYTPQPAAPFWRAHEYRGTLSDTWDTPHGIFESAVSVSELRGITGSHGSQILALTPVTSRGSYFFTQDRRAQRGQLLETWSPKRQHARGTHDIKLGGSIGRATLAGGAAARSVLIESLSGDPLAGLAFRNLPPYRLTDWDVSLFAQDGWSPHPQVRLDFGTRIDRQRLTARTTIAPRLGVAWMPTEAGRTVLRGGFGWFFDRTPLNVFAFPANPERDGLPNLLVPGRGFAPRSRTLSTQVDHWLGQSVLLHAGYVHSDHSGLLVLTPGSDATRLSGAGKAATREIEFTSKFRWYPEQEWVVSYVHTRGRGNQNAFDRYLGNFPEPILRPDLTATLPGLVPHRLLSWGVFPLPRELRFSPIVEWRNGFPYSALDEFQRYAGTPNSRRLPAFFSLDLRMSRDIKYRNHKFRVSFAMFNVTNHGNFDAVRLNIADPQFGEVLGRRPRRFRLDFDWLY